MASKSLGIQFLLLSLVFSVGAIRVTGASAANRLTYLDANDPFYVDLRFPKLATPQWVGEPGVEAVVVLAIDDLREPQKYEAYLRPILNRLKEIDGRAPVSIYCNTFDPDHPQFQSWLEEGLSLEVHTLTHPCPLLAKNDFETAANTVHKGVELLDGIPGNRAVAFRMPCCDSINSPSPRFYAEIFNRTSRNGKFMTIDSSVMNITTADDPLLPRPLVVDGDGGPKFKKYVPFPAFSTTVENYPYPYVIGKLCWEFPAMAPSDWEAQHIHGVFNPITVADWKAALDATVLKQGTFTFIFHPHGWIRPDQMVEFIEYAVQKHGKAVKFLNFREAEERMNRHLLAGQPLRDSNGGDNGARLADLNADGFIDVVIGNEDVRKTRVWNPDKRVWIETGFPVALAAAPNNTANRETSVRFGIVRSDDQVSLLISDEQNSTAWTFDGSNWVEDRALLSGLELNGKIVSTSLSGRDQGVRFRDVDGDGRCELIVSNPSQNAVFGWEPKDGSWKKLEFSLPGGTSIVDAEGRDNGLRFVDLNEDGYDDVLFSNSQRYSLHLFVPEVVLGFERGWSREVLAGARGEAGEIPMIARGGDHPNNGAWFRSRHFWVQNEDTANLPDLVDRRSFDELLAGVQPSPKSPGASLESIRVRPGFKVELVAHEPLVQDPIAFEWGADGKLWVVEMGDYPLGIDEKGQPGGIVRFLEDSDQDGVYDKSSVFLESVNFPTGVIPWGKGVLVSAAPEIFYAEDTDGDGRADLRKILLTGFREGNQQHRVNGFEFGLDNWVYGANGDSGGEIRVVGSVSDASGGGETNPSPPVNISGRDFRFRPGGGLFETVEGQTQFGRRRDDWGNWFGNNNPSWGWHYYFPERYLSRNPSLVIRSAKRYFANYPDSTRVFALSRPMQRFNAVGAANHVTSGNSVTPYRDELFGPEFAGSVFVSEPVHNVVHREILEADGVSFRSRRAVDEKDREFLASSDNWFRPTMLKTGPDGALYIADMYRLVLEHPEWIPHDTQKRFDLRSGSDKGRIYRVLPENATLRAIPRLSQFASGDLVAALNSPNGWQRDTAQRLLVERGDGSVAGLLKRTGALSPNPKARLQVLYTLDGLGELNPDLLAMALADRHPAVREHAIRLSESHLRKASSMDGTVNAAPDGFGRLADQLLRAVRDPNERVRYQLAFSLGEWSDQRAAKALAALAARSSENPELRAAILSSAIPHVRGLLDMILAGARSSFPSDFVSRVFELAAVSKDGTILNAAIGGLLIGRDESMTRDRIAAMEGFLDGIEHDHVSLERFGAGANSQLKKSIQSIDGLFAMACEVVSDAKNPDVARMAAIRVLGRGLSNREAHLRLLASFVTPQNSVGLQKAALGRLGSSDDPSSVPEMLLQNWRESGPSIRGEILDLLLSRPEWAGALLGKIEQGVVVIGEISVAHRQRLLGNGRPEIRDRARRLFSIQSDRREVLDGFRQVAMLRGNAGAGAELFRQHCVVCHRFRGEGNEVGPDLAALSDKSAQGMVTAILDPNQAVEAKYVSYSVLTASGREVSGVITAETQNSISMRTAAGSEETILRSEIKEISSSGLSLMPEGLEEAFQPQDLADLIAYLNLPNRDGT